MAWPVGIVVEHRSFEVECVPDVSSHVPPEAKRPGIHFVARPWCRETERDRLGVGLEHVIARRNLEGAPVTGAEVEVVPWAHACRRIAGRRRAPTEQLRLRRRSL